MTARTVAKAMDKQDAGLDKFLWSKARHFESILPDHVDVKAFLGTAWAALLADETLMANAIRKPDSLLIALFRCAAKGHQPGTEEYYLTPRDGGILGIEGYRGVIERMYRSGAVAKVTVREVCAKDYFRFVEGEDEKPVHDFAAKRGGTTGADFFGEDADTRGAMVGVYAVAQLLTGAWSRPVLLGRGDVFAARMAGGWKGPEDKYSPWNRMDGGPDHPEFQGRSMWWKHLHVDTPIPTPSGWSTMGQLEAGHVVLDRDGQPTRVLGKSPVRHDKTCYEVRFTTGEPVICSDEHIWVARIGKQREREHTTEDLRAAKAAGKPVVIPVAAPLDLPAADLPVDPWLLGYWLGNGTRGSARVTARVEDAAEITAAIASAGYEVGAVTTTSDEIGQRTHIGILRLAKPLAELGVLGDKHVPAVYLRGSYEQRLALLRGLMDSDGSAETGRRRVGFSSTRERLRDAAAELARSLGEQVTTYERDATGFGKTVREYVASWGPAVMPFTVARKADMARLRVNASYGHRVKSIELVPTAPVQCIMVDSATSTYLCGEAMIPTHNTAARRLEPWVPTSAEYHREQIRAAASAAAAQGKGIPAPQLAAVEPAGPETPAIDGPGGQSPQEPEGPADQAAPGQPRNNRGRFTAGEAAAPGSGEEAASDDG